MYVVTEEFFFSHMANNPKFSQLEWTFFPGLALEEQQDIRIFNNILFHCQSFYSEFPIKN